MCRFRPSPAATPWATTYAAGIEIQSGGLTLDNQGSAPTAVTGASTFYSSVLGRPRYISSVGDDSALERSVVSQTNVNMTTQTIATAISPALTIQSGEANVGSEFEIEIEGIITAPTGGGSFVNNATGPAYTIQMMINGSVIGGGGDARRRVPDPGKHVQLQRHVQAVHRGDRGRAAPAPYRPGARPSSRAATSATPWAAAPRSRCHSPFSTVGAGKAIDTTTSNTVKVFGFWGSVVGLTGHKVTVVPVQDRQEECEGLGLPLRPVVRVVAVDGDVVAACHPGRCRLAEPHALIAG